jgi:hypothetical protein
MRLIVSLALAAVFALSAPASAAGLTHIVLKGGLYDVKVLTEDSGVVLRSMHIAADIFPARSKPMFIVPDPFDRWFGVRVSVGPTHFYVGNAAWKVAHKAQWYIEPMRIASK